MEGLGVLGVAIDVDKKVAKFACIITYDCQMTNYSRSSSKTSQRCKVSLLRNSWRTRISHKMMCLLHISQCQKPMRIYCKSNVYLGKCFRPVFGILFGKTKFNRLFNRSLDRCYCTTTLNNEPSLSSLGIGLGQWPEHCDNDHLYRSIIETSLFRNNDVSNTIEIGFLENHDLSFANAYRSVVEDQSKLHLQPPLGETDKEESEEFMQGNALPYVPPKIHILWRIGYRFEENTHPLLKGIKNVSTASTGNVGSDAQAPFKAEFDDTEAPVTSSSFLDDGSTQNIYPRKKPFAMSHILDVVQVDDPPPTRIKLLQPPKLVHNVSPDYIHHVLNPNGKHVTLHTLDSDTNTTQEVYDTPPLVQLKKDFPEQITLTVVIHNPESQLSRYYIAQKQNHPSITNIPTPQVFLESIVYTAFKTLQQYCTTSTSSETFDTNEFLPIIDGYGVISNGLSLPKHHPLHVSHHSILNAAKRVYQDDLSRRDEPAFRTIQLPANALETTGIDVARQIQLLKQKEIYSNMGRPTYISNASIYAIRPLTCYSDGGTGNGGSELSSKSHPFSLLDFKIEMKKDKKAIVEWTNMMRQPPPEYNAAYQRAIQLFDGQEILEKQADRRRKKQRENEEKNVSPIWTDLVKDLEDHLTDEERETLHGCQLLQNMIQKLDAALEDVRSIKTHEVLLSTEVIPTLRDKFESYDEHTSYTLEAYFTAYGKAMHYYVAKNTRQLLRYGESNATDLEPPTEIAAPTYGEKILSKGKRLQEFGIELLLNQTTGLNFVDVSASSPMPLFPTVKVFDVIMVGLSNLEEVYDTIEIFKNFQKANHQP
jgi:hypothetical protein